MSGVVRKLLVVAAADALFLQPTPVREDTGVEVTYKTAAIRHRRKSSSDQHVADRSFEVYGVVGLLNVLSSSWLITISGRREVAQVFGKPIFLVMSVAFIPLVSQSEAGNAIVKAQDLRDGEKRDEPTQADIEDEPDDSPTNFVTDIGRSSGALLSDRTTQRRGTQEDPYIVDVAGKKGLQQPSLERISADAIGDSYFQYVLGKGQGMPLIQHERGQNTSRPTTSMPIDYVQPTISYTGSAVNDAPKALPTAATTEEVVVAALSRLLHTLDMLLTSNTFFFSYDHDITTSFGLHKQISSGAFKWDCPRSEFTWNGHLMHNFSCSGFSHYTIPIMQGYVGQQAIQVKQSRHPCTISAPTTTREQDQTADENQHEVSSLLTLISRRSTQRAGFRYLRRGIDEEGNVANGVETEQILSTTDWSSGPIHSFLQTRGSIPLYFTQTPYPFEPLPTLHGSQETNRSAILKHFNRLMYRYGDVQAVSLVDSHGSEPALGKSYADYVNDLKSSGILDSNNTLKFTWFDFHAACSGMKFENVSQCVEELAPFLSASSWTSSQKGRMMHRQTGIVRSNCMDCLDRTNVVQSAIGLHISHQQLGLAFNDIIDESSLNADIIISNFSKAHSMLWASNGDALSLAYTHTPALKGDYVRHGKRTIFGAITDLSHTMHRYYRNIFDDYFAQACLDYALGNVGLEVFEDLAERGVGEDPGWSLQKTSQKAINSSIDVIVEKECSSGIEVLGAWVLEVSDAFGRSSRSQEKVEISPAILRAQPFAANVVALTLSDLRMISYDWVLETPKDVIHTVPLLDLMSIQVGAYITDTETRRQTAPQRNHGVLITYSPATSGRKERCLAFKIPTHTCGSQKPSQERAYSVSEVDQAWLIVHEIARAIKTLCDKDVKIVEEDIMNSETVSRCATYGEVVKRRAHKTFWG